MPVPKARSRPPWPAARRAAAAVLLALALRPGPLHAAPTGTSEDARRAEAGRAVAAGEAAFATGDHAAALAEFTRAMQLRPASKLHYNIGVCHQRLTREAATRGDTDAEARHASAAIAAFNAYLQARPDASDRAAVEDLVRELGGTPATQAQLRDPLAGLEPAPPSAPANATTNPTTSEPTPPPTTPPPPELRGWFGVLLGVTAQPQLQDNPGVDGAVQGLLGLRGGARLGARRRFELGGQLWLAAPGETRKTNLALSMQALLLDLGHAVPLGQRRRFELSAGGLLGIARETLRLRPGQPPPPCSVEGARRLVSARAGGVVGGRIGFAVLVGARRHHELGMHFTLAFIGTGPGSAADHCDERPFAAQAVPRARAVIVSALGYAFRF